MSISNRRVCVNTGFSFDDICTDYQAYVDRLALLIHLKQLEGALAASLWFFVAVFTNKSFSRVL